MSNQAWTRLVGEGPSEGEVICGKVGSRYSDVIEESFRCAGMPPLRCDEMPLLRDAGMPLRCDWKHSTAWHSITG